MSHVRQCAVYVPGTCVDRAAGPVLDGYDVVAYHSLNADAAAVAGSSSYTATVFGYTWSVIAPHALSLSPAPANPATMRRTVTNHSAFLSRT